MYFINLNTLFLNNLPVFSSFRFYIFPCEQNKQFTSHRRIFYLAAPQSAVKLSAKNSFDDIKTPGNNIRGLGNGGERERRIQFRSSFEIRLSVKIGLKFD